MLPSLPSVLPYSFSFLLLLFLIRCSPCFCLFLSPFLRVWMFCNGSLLWGPVQLVLRHAAVFILWCSLCRCLRLFPQRRWIPFSGHADSGLHRHYDIKQHRVLFLLCVGWFHSALFNPPLRFDWDLSCVQLSCVQYTTPFLLLPALRSRLIADAELYIQVNSWASWPLFNGCVRCLYHIHTQLLCSSTVNPSGSFKLS